MILTQPHGGTWVPEDVLRDDFGPAGRALADTDWWQRELYTDLLDGATQISTDVSRYVIDCNRPPDGTRLYARHNTTQLCPLTDFEGNPLYRPGREPADHEVHQRIEAVHQPYHDAVAAQIQRLRRRHAHVLLFDGHSIRSVLPFLFEGRLPSFSWGTAHGTTCSPTLARLAYERSRSWGGPQEAVLNGRFVGGWTVRRHGRPDRGVHALQLEMTQAVYLRKETPPWERDGGAWTALRCQLAALLDDLLGALSDLPAATAK